MLSPQRKAVMIIRRKGWNCFSLVLTSILSSFKALLYYGVLQTREGDCCIKRVLFLVKDTGRWFPQRGRRAEDLVMGVVLVGVSSSLNSADRSKESETWQ